MKVSKTNLGADHPDTLIKMESLTFTRKYPGQDAEAMNLLRYFLAKQKQTSGLKHWQTLANSTASAEWEMEGQNNTSISSIS